MKEVTKIRVGFENLEYMEFEVNEIASLLINNIVTQVQRFAINSVAEMFKCSEVFMELIPAANRKHCAFGVEDEHTTTTFQRIREYDDITSIEVFYDDGTSKDVYVPWEDASGGGEVNKYQSSYYSDNGALYIYINKDQVNVRSMLDLDEINDPNYAKYLDPSWFK